MMLILIKEKQFLSYKCFV